MENLPWIFLGFLWKTCEAKFEAIAAASVWIWPGWKTNCVSVTRLLRVVQESQAQETIEENRPQRQDQETQDWWNVVFANCWKWILEQQNFALFPEVTKASERFCCQSSLTAGETSWQVRNLRKKTTSWGKVGCFPLVGWHLWLEQPHGRATRMFKKIGDLLGAASRCSNLTSVFCNFCSRKARLLLVELCLPDLDQEQFDKWKTIGKFHCFTLWSLEFLLYKL